MRYIRTTDMKFVAKSNIITLRVQQIWELFSNIACKMVLDSVAYNSVSFAAKHAFIDSLYMTNTLL